MANEFVCITRKIEVYLHKYGDDDESKLRYDAEREKWRAINDNLYKAATDVALIKDRL